MTTQDLRAISLACSGAAVLAVIGGDLLRAAIFVLAAAVWWVASELAGLREDADAREAGQPPRYR